MPAGRRGNSIGNLSASAGVDDDRWERVRRSPRPCEVRRKFTAAVTPRRARAPSASSRRLTGRRYRRRDGPRRPAGAARGRGCSPARKAISVNSAIRLQPVADNAKRWPARPRTTYVVDSSGGDSDFVARRSPRP
ncbi:hypothetical protein EVAR_82830_1 [Eumeta japonica]|uniref:Uncharacterized protein n=1 Tax=Eumeta variegata TaxID=151549 RepID=A0A4C1V3Z9_EUMVA|nr:hypothetical protein EVAR_82830_1 [Eumeta japonica]